MLELQLIKQQRIMGIQSNDDDNDLLVTRLAVKTVKRM